MYNLLKILLLSILTLKSLNAMAQERNIQTILTEEKTHTALTEIEAKRMDAANLLIKLGGIVSPSGAEHDRAEAVAAEMRKIGLVDVHVNEAPNVIGKIKGRTGKAVIFVSTLDDLTTVAEHQKAAGRLPYIENDRVIGPGTNTSLTTVALLTAAKTLVENGYVPEHDIIFTGVAQEETGLRGMKHLYEEYKESAVAFVDVLGDGRSISYGALGIHWWKIHAFGPAGHTLLGGLPNINQAIGRAVDRILQIPEPQIYEDRRTRLNVAVLSSGSIFNHKPETGWFSLDVRSLDIEHIETMEQKVRDILDRVTEELGITFEMEAISNTPPGQIEGALDSSLVKTAQEASRFLGYEPTLSDAGSANLNVSIAGGTLSIGLGGSRGGQRGFSDEWADIGVMQRTAQHVFLTAIAVANAE